MEAYKKADEQRMGELSTEISKLDRINASCIIPPGEPSQESRNHVCIISPEVLVPKPVSISSGRAEIPTMISPSYSDVFQGIKCDDVRTNFDGEEYILYCTRECSNIEIKPISCVIEKGQARITINRTDATSYLIGLNFFFSFSLNDDPKMIPMLPIHTSEYPNNFGTKTIEVDSVAPNAIIKFADVMIQPHIKTKFTDANYPYPQREIYCGVVERDDLKTNCTIISQ